MKRITKIDGLSPAVAPYSFATITDNMVYTAGQIAQTAEGSLASGGIETETQQVMRNLAKILQAAEVDFAHVVRATIYLTDVADFATVNQIYAGYFPDGAYPVRETTTTAGLPLGAKVEISLIATRS